jgi:signal transduction histidine kinase
VLPRLWARNPDEGHRRLEELRQLTRGALAEMRTLLLELRPSALDEAQLGDLLRQLGESITGRARVPVYVTSQGHCDVPSEVKVALYRIAQEALNNVAKHSGAHEARIGLHCSESGVRIEIADDGCGFDMERIPINRLGLNIMRERAESAGATLEIDSAPGEGTRVHVHWAAP